MRITMVALAVLALSGCAGDETVSLRVTDTQAGGTSASYGSASVRCDAGFTLMGVVVGNGLERPLSLQRDHWRVSFEGASRTPAIVDGDSLEVAPGGKLPVTLRVCGPEGRDAHQVFLYSRDPLGDPPGRLLAQARA